MIPNQWYAVLESKEIPTGKPVGVTRLGEKLVFWRTSTGEVACQENTLVYTRFYHRVIRVPGLRQLISWSGRYFSRVIALQDRRVVNTQRPKKTALRMGENLFPADRPIMEYRRRREELLAASRGPLKDKA